MSVSFETVTVVPATLEEVFDRSLDVDFHQDSMAHSSEEAIGGVRSGVMTLGDTVTWRARHFGIWWTMTSEITAFERPHRFIDEQRRGPFRSFWHEHRFEPHDAGTLMTDRVRFEAPLGPLGRVAETAVLGRHLRQLIELRNAALVAGFADGT